MGQTFLSHVYLYILYFLGYSRLNFSSSFFTIITKRINVTGDILCSFFQFYNAQRAELQMAEIRYFHLMFQVKVLPRVKELRLILSFFIKRRILINPLVGRLVGLIFIFFRFVPLIFFRFVPIFV